jgi:hypothetical protein
LVAKILTCLISTIQTASMIPSSSTFLKTMAATELNILFLKCAKRLALLAAKVQLVLYLIALAAHKEGEDE